MLVGAWRPVLYMHFMLSPLQHSPILTSALCLTLMELDLSVICFPHPQVTCSNSAHTPQPQLRFKDLHLDRSMQNKYKRQQQHELECRRRKPVDYGRRTMMQREKETTDNNHNNSCGETSNSTSSYLHNQQQSHRWRGGGSRGRSARPGFDPQTDDSLYKTSVRGPNLQARWSVNEKKLVNRRLACFMSNKYLTSGTLLGRPWPPQELNPSGHGIYSKSTPKSASLDQDEDESRREKEALYHTITDSLQAGDVHLPSIVNPSQLAAWLGLGQ